jgi:hypothetical protein
MSDPTSAPLDSTDIQISIPGSFPSQTPDDITRLADQDVPLVGKPATSVRAPRPAGLTWAQLQNVEKDASGEHHAIAPRSAASHSGPVSPISPISSSEALRTPNLDRQKNNPYRTCSSPGSSSTVPPRLHSPASQIFERSVQEDILPIQAASPSIPAHIRTENYIPPVLEASSAAITDQELDPDSVEIVTHSLHQPATGIATSTAEQSLSSSGIVDHAGLHSDADEMSSSHGASDTDVRRLSFISFADVVNAEHAAEHAEVESVYSRDPSQPAASGNPITIGSLNRSPSPLRSPTSSHGLGTSPPTSIATSYKGLDMSPGHHGVRRPGSPLPLAQSPVSSGFSGELNVETMRQALRRTGSGDLGGVMSQTTSAIGVDETVDRLS